MNVGRKDVAVAGRLANRLRAIDIEIGLPEHAGSFERCYRIAPQAEAVPGAHLHDDFNWSQLLVFIRHNPHADYVADIHAIQTHGRSYPQSAGIIKERFDGDAMREQSA